MFDQLKNVYNLRKQAAELKQQLEREKITAASDDGLVTLTLSGSQEILEVKIDPTQTLTAQALEAAFKNAYRKASDELKNLLSRKFAGMF